jgi:hypothetical protein
MGQTGRLHCLRSDSALDAIVIDFYATVRRPPSKAAVTFFRETAGNEKAVIVSSYMAGVAHKG